MKKNHFYYMVTVHIKNINQIFYCLYLFILVNIEQFLLLFSKSKKEMKNKEMIVVTMVFKYNMQFYFT